MSSEGTIPSKCSHCGKEFLAGGGYAGRKVRCPNKACGQPVRIPAEDEDLDFAQRSRPARRPAPKAESGVAWLPWSLAAFFGLLVLVMAVLYLGERSAAKREADRWASADGELRTASAKIEQVTGQVLAVESRLAAEEAKSSGLAAGKAAAEKKAREATQELNGERAVTGEWKAKAAAAEKSANDAAAEVKNARSESVRFENELKVARKDLADSKAKIAARDDQIAKMKKAQLAKLDRSHFVGKWLMSDGVIEFKDDGVFMNLGDMHRWEYASGELTLIFSGKKEKREFELNGDRLTLVFDNGNRVGALRLGSRELSSTGKWTIADLSGEWGAGESIKLTLNPEGKGSCNSQIKFGNGLANFEFANVAVDAIGDIHTIRIQKLNWVLRPSNDRKTLDLIAADESMINPSTITLKKK